MKKGLSEIFNPQSKHVFIIAEAGVNHSGKLDTALQLVDAAAQSGADCVKFQTFRGGDLVTKDGEMTAYQQVNLGVRKTQKQMLEELALSAEFYNTIIQRCHERNVMFMSTPHGGFTSVDFLEKFNVPGYKVGSGDLTNIPLLQYIANLGKPMIISTGMAIKTEIDEAIKAIETMGNTRIVVLHCTSNYPCPPIDVNLAAMVQMINDYKYPIGYSDHTLGTDVSVYACLLGARVIEKHLTLDRNLPGPDQVNSLEPHEFKNMVSKIRDIEKLTDEDRKKEIRKIPSELMGSPVKKPNSLEIEIARQVRKSIVYVHNIPNGQILTREDLDIKRPATGIHPRELYNMIGKVLTHDVKGDSVAQMGDFS